MKESIATLHKYIIKNPQDTAALVRLAESYREAGKTHQALSSFKKLIDIDSGNYQALNNYGALLLNSGDAKSAESILLRANTLLPNSPIILSNLANTYSALDRFDLALKTCHQALSIQPDFFDAHEALGHALLGSGARREAITALNKALEICPDSNRIIILLAEAWHYLGKDKKAYNLIKPMLNNNAPDCATIYFKISRKLGLREYAVKYILNIIKNQKKKTKALGSLYFCLGNHYDETGHFEEAFSYYYQANKLGEHSFDINDTIKKFDNIIAIFPKGSTDRIPTASNTSKQPIFIVGMPRTGTSLIEQILASHSQVFGAGELRNINIAAQETEEHNKYNGSNLIYGSLDVNELDSIASDYLKYINEVSNNAARVTDKMPHNFIHIGFILHLFPSATIINCTRHPLDSCLSCYISNFGSVGHEYSYNLNTLAKYYLQYNRLMSHWTDQYGDKILEVKYENLIMDHEYTCKQLIQHCGLDWEEQCLDFHSNKRKTLTMSYDQVNKPIYTKSVFRWKNYDKHLNKIKKTLSEAIISYENNLNY